MTKLAASPETLLALALAYSEATGVALSTIGKRACGNPKIFVRLAEGQGSQRAATVARAVEWFAANWPPNTEWPSGRSRYRIKAKSAMTKAHQGGEMPKLPTDEVSNLLEISLVDDQSGKLKIRLRVDRIIHWELGMKIIQMIGEDSETGPAVIEQNNAP